VSLALYRKYRPSSFGEVIGQDHVTEPLRNALRTGQVHHAYLFSGPRGCGKTSSARILARSLNCAAGPTPEPCGTCQSCTDLVANGPGSLDVVELDAATHGLVDDARELRERAFYAPASSRYKIYIIDEAHQLGPGASNALLKVVEEPPPHVVFIFATTEPEKVITTIRSRTHHYPFRLVPPGILSDHLGAICKSENVEVDKGVLPLVVRAGGGSVRDALSVLGQLFAGAAEAGVTYPMAISLLGFTDSALLDDAVDAFAAADGATVFSVIDRLIEGGHDPRRFAQDLLERLRDLMIIDAVPQAAHSVLRDLPEDQLERMRAQAQRFGGGSISRAADIVSAGLTEMRGATAPRLLLELIAARVLLPAADSSERGLVARVERLERRIAMAGTVEAATEVVAAAPAVSAPAPIRPTKKATATSTPAAEPTPVVTPATAPAVPSSAGADVAGVRRLWPEIVDNVKARRRLTWSLLTGSAQIAAIDEKVLTLALTNAGARESFTRSGSDEIVRQALIDVVGIDRRVEAIVDPAASPMTPAVPSRKSGDKSPPAEVAAEQPDPNDENLDVEDGAALLARELGAKVIGEYPAD
jgi:DNA polymerase III subunit gamma/tau